MTVLGPGQRIGIWFQGCSIRCRGCVSRDTWDPDDGVEASVPEVIVQCRAWSDARLVEGVTISGGEPFDQPVALLALLDSLDDWRRTCAPDADLLCYSGYTEARLRAQHPEILARLDAMIPGRYVAARAPGGRWRGSSNQRIVPLSPLGYRRYADVPEAPPTDPAVQVVVDEGVWIIGVPRPGDMDRVETILSAQGILLKEPSWR